MSDVEALPVAAPVAEVGEQPVKVEAPEVEKIEGEPKPDDKPAKSPEQKAIERLERKLGRVIGQREEARAEREQLRQQIAGLQSRDIGDTNQSDSTDSDTLSLTRAQLRAVIEAEAKKLAPTIKGNEESVSKQREVVSGLVKEWGLEAFQERTNDLAEVLDQNKQMLVLDTENPAALIEYLTDDENADEADAIARMPIGRAGYALAKIVAKIEAAKSESKPKASKAPAPIEAGRGQGSAPLGYHPNMTDAQYAAWRKSQKAR